MKNEQVRSNIPKMAVHVSLRRLSDTNGSSNSLCSLHYHDELELILVRRGDFVTIVDDVEYLLHEGDVVFINSGVPHSTYTKSPS